MKPKCPNTECGAELQYVTRDYNYHLIETFWKDGGSVDFSHLDDSMTDEEFECRFWCDNCSKEYTYDTDKGEFGEFGVKSTGADGVMPSPLRDYGYGPSPEVAGAPRIIGEVAQICPNCECEKVFAIEVLVESLPPMLRMPDGHVAVGKYAGCAACPWASPMITTARKGTT